MRPADMSDNGLFDAAVHAIWQAASGSGNAYDYATEELLPESQRRLEAAGHDKWCRSGIYNRAYELAIAQHAHRKPAPNPCTCGKEDM